MLQIGGTTVPAAILCDFVVDKRYRVAGAAVSLQRKLAEACFADGVKLIYGFPNRGAFPVFKRVGYKTVGTATMMVRPLRSKHHLRDYVPAVLADTAGFFVDRLLHVYDLQLCLRQTRDMSDTQRNLADGSFQTLWDEVKGAQAIVAERTPGYLNWRYASHPLDTCNFFCLTERFSGRLRGYVAYCVTAGKVHVLDAFWASASTLQPLFVRFVWRMRSLGYASVSVCHAGDAAGRPERYGSWRSSSRRSRRNLVCKVAANGTANVGTTAYDLTHWSAVRGRARHLTGRFVVVSGALSWKDGGRNGDGGTQAGRSGGTGPRGNRVQSRRSRRSTPAWCGRPALNPGKPPRPLSMVWLHHSTGDRLLRGGLLEALRERRPDVPRHQLRGSDR